MFGINNFATFFITALFFVMTPGIDTVFVLNKSISHGRKSGIYASLGINAGLLVHTLFAAMGLSIVIAQSAYAFSIIKYAGAAYLIFLGINNIIRKKHETMKVSASYETAEPPLKCFTSGVFTNVLNPKVALFFLAFFPQFISQETISSPLPFLALGITYASIGLCWYISLSLFTSIFSDKLNKVPALKKWMDKISGLVYIIMGIKVALSKSS